MCNLQPVKKTAVPAKQARHRHKYLPVVQARRIKREQHGDAAAAGSKRPGLNLRKKRGGMTWTKKKNRIWYIKTHEKLSIIISARYHKEEDDKVVVFVEDGEKRTEEEVKDEKDEKEEDEEVV